ncbi:MAG: polysaccharide biosynthesis C-terminal domain-containing protein [Clostridia bacterium]|nr:polysaccharide biosynthesis C-terminal domain-containing protein [Clostridia bacterium]
MVKALSPRHAKQPTAAGRFALNALSLIAVNLFMRTVGVAFNAYLAGRAGGEVMGLYSLLFGVYGLAMTLGSAGIHLGTTRMVADVMGQFCPEGNGAGEGCVGEVCRRAIRRVMVRCLTYSLVCGAGAGLLMLVSAPWIGREWLGDGRTVLSLRVLALTLPPIAVSACLGGYFTAVRRVVRTSAVGIGVQFLRIGFCAYLLTLWLPEGVEMTCLALVLGGALSEFCGLLMTVGAYLYDRRKHLRLTREGACEDMGEAVSTKKLLGITVPVTLAACLRSGLLTLQHILIPRGLKRSGASWEAALTSYGVLHSMALPVVLFPSAFISSFSGLLVPEVAESVARGDHKRVARLAFRTVTPALIFSFGVAGVMGCFGRELGVAVYGSAEAGEYIRLLAPLIPIMYVDSTVDAFLKGMGEQVYSMNVNIIDAGASVLLVWLLLPRMGLAGYVVAIYVTETLNTTLSLCRMLRMSRMPVKLWKQVFGPLLCAVGAATVCRLVGAVFQVHGNGTARVILWVTVCAAVYLVLCLLTNVWGREQTEDLRKVFGHKQREA